MRIIKVFLLLCLLSLSVKVWGATGSVYEFDDDESELPNGKPTPPSLSSSRPNVPQENAGQSNNSSFVSTSSAVSNVSGKSTAFAAENRTKKLMAYWLSKTHQPGGVRFDEEPSDDESYSFSTRSEGHPHTASAAAINAASQSAPPTAGPSASSQEERLFELE